MRYEDAYRALTMCNSETRAACLVEVAREVESTERLAQVGAHELGLASDVRTVLDGAPGVRADVTRERAQGLGAEVQLHGFSVRENEH